MTTETRRNADRAYRERNKLNRSRVSDLEAAVKELCIENMKQDEEIVSLKAQVAHLTQEVADLKAEMRNHRHRADGFVEAPEGEF